MDFNDRQETLAARWAITPSAVARLTGANREAIRSYFTQNAQRIQAHHDRHGITERNNYLHGRHKQKIEDAMDAIDSAPPPAIADADDSI